jgi:hypothetical protein
VSGSSNGGSGRRKGGGRSTEKQSRRREPPPLPRRPYRDSALLHAVLALVIVAVALFTGGSTITGILVAAAYFLVATTWSWVRFSQRLRAAEAAEQTERTERPR